MRHASSSECRAQTPPPRQEVPAKKKRASRMTVANDEVATVGQVVAVNLPELVGPDSLHPGRDPLANVRASPRALPELAARAPRGTPDLRDLARSGVPRPHAEVVEAVEAVVFLPDQPPTVVRGGRLVEFRIGEGLDPNHGSCPPIDLRHAGEAPRVDRGEERPAVIRQRQRNERSSPREGEDVTREHVLPRRARARLAPPSAREGRRGSGGTRRSERRRQGHDGAEARQLPTRRSHVRRRSRRSDSSAGPSTRARFPTS